MTSAIFLFAILLVLLFLSIPIAFAIGLACLVYVLISPIFPIATICTKMIISNDSFIFIAVPLFTLAGNLMVQSGMSDRVVRFVNSMFGWIPGNFGAVSIITCAIFAALTGSGVATVVAVGGIMYPLMVESGYQKSAAAGTIAAGGMLGPIIPPSIAMIVYGSCMGVSISDLFKAGIVPGLLITFFFLVWNMFYAVTHKLPRTPHGKSGREIARLTVQAIPVLLVPVIVLGGIYGGIVTPTEAATLAVIYTLLYMILSRQFTFAKLIDASKGTVIASASIMLIVNVANSFASIMAMEKIPGKLASAVIPYVGSDSAYFIVLIVILLITGALMDTAPSILILAPVLVPIGLELGIDKLHLGTVFCVTIVLGLITPPFGLNLFTISTISGEPFQKVVKGVLPFIICSILAVLLIAYVPQLLYIVL